MTIAYLGSLSVGDTIPGAVTGIEAGISGINIALPNLADQLAALNAFVPAPIDFTAQLALANAMVNGITLAIAGGLVPPDLAAQLAIIAAQIAAITAQLASVNASLSVLTALSSPLAAAGVHGYAFDGLAGNFGAELSGAIGVTPGVSGSDHADGIALMTTVGATWDAMGLVFKVTP